MYSQDNVREESVQWPSTRALSSLIVDIEKVLREADGPTKARGPKASKAWWVERCSPLGAPQNWTMRAATLQFGSQIYSYASSYENSCSGSSGGQGMRKIGENFGVELEKSQK